MTVKCRYNLYCVFVVISKFYFDKMVGLMAGLTFRAISCGLAYVVVLGCWGIYMRWDLVAIPKISKINQTDVVVSTLCCGNQV